MKKRYTEEQIVKILKEVEATGKPAEACRKYGVSDARKCFQPTCSINYFSYF